MSIIKSNMTAPPPPTGGALSSISEMNSLRFDGSSYLSRTFGTATDSKSYTLSLWVKKSQVGGDSNIFSTATGSLTDYDHLRFDGSDTVQIFLNGAADLSVKSTALFRDLSSWYHVVLKVDTAQSIKHEVYVNNVNVISSGSVSTNYVNDFNTAIQHTLGANLRGGTYLNGYLANIQFIDGQALSPYFFGELVGGVWTPKAFDGTASDGNNGSATSSYGTNGFRLTFAPDTVVSNQFQDQSPNSNHWDIN